jgi:hypothetical protein
MLTWAGNLEEVPSMGPDEAVISKFPALFARSSRHVRVSAHRERADRSIVNAGIGLIPAT